VHVLGFALEEADVLGLPVRVVHVVRHGLEAVLPEELETLVDTWSAKFPEIEVSTALLSGDPAVALEEAARRAELVVVSGRPVGRFASGVLGSVSQAVLRRAVADVAVVG
jgi:nucleotide-binding universal stress UspA family protein